MKKEAKIVIDYQDWLDEYKKKGIVIKNEEDLLTLMQESKIKPSELARLVIVGREQGDTDKDIIKSNKVSLEIGASGQITRMVVSRFIKLDIHGKKFKSREFVAEVPEEENGGPTIVHAHDPKAVDRAERYLMRTVMGFVWRRLVLIAGSGGDVEEIVENVKVKLDDMVVKLG